MAEKRRTTTRLQFERLVSLIERNDEVIREKKKGSAKFWETISKELNALGPPVKDATGWKKVWADYRSSLKKKLAHNNSEYRATGGGPCTLHNFTALEEHVIEILEMNDGIEGVSNATMLGEPRPQTSSTSAVLPPTQRDTDETTQSVQDEMQDVSEEIDAADGSQHLASNAVKKSVLYLQLVEQRRYNNIKEKMLAVKIKEVELKTQELALKKEIAAKEFEFKQALLAFKQEMANKQLELKIQIAEREYELKMRELGMRNK